ncbi:MAG TPA: septation protein SpoVG family protein [Candidatus Hypogeohydataceae bacterium YC41]
MEITEVMVRLTESRENRLQAFCGIIIDNEFVVKDLKIIEGHNGAFVAMPSRKITDRCPKCRGKNHLRSHYCSDCGTKLDEKRYLREGTKIQIYADTAHPINAKCREVIQQKVLAAFKEELKKSTQLGYKPTEVEHLEDIDNGKDHPEEERFGEGILP